MILLVPVLVPTKMVLLIAKAITRTPETTLCLWDARSLLLLGNICAMHKNS